MDIERFTPKAASERLYLGFDFSALAPSVTSAEWTVLRVAGPADASPQDMLDGPAAAVGARSWQYITGGTPGTEYLVQCLAETPNGRYLAQGLLLVATPPAVAEP